MTKSGSTLAFELCKSVLEQEGFEQRRLPDDVVTAGHHINFMDRVTPEDLRKVLEVVGPKEKIAIKTHAPIAKQDIAFVERQVAEGRMGVHVNYRDPREVCLSLVDAGAKAREKDKPAFSEIFTLGDAAKVVQRQLAFCRRWASIRGAFFLFYNDVAFDTRQTVDRLCVEFGFPKFSDDGYKAVAARVFEEAFTQKNKAVKDRYKDDLTVRQNEFLLQEIKGAPAFIRKLCDERDYGWFAARDAEPADA
jgi:hypothetical protein